MFRAGSQVSWYEWILPISSWDFTIRTFICPFFYTFSVIFQWQHVIWCQKWWYELLGPWPMCPPSFIEIASKEEWNLTNLLTTTTARLIIIAKMKPHKNKIPFPFWGNGITRGTVPRGTVDPIPNELSLWPRTMFRQVTPSHYHCSAPPLYRHVWDYCQTGIIARVAL